MIGSMIYEILRNTPFYPFWLESLKSRNAETIVFQYAKGTCLEVGCGNTNTKKFVTRINKNITDYVATDYIGTHHITGNRNMVVDDYTDALHLKYSANSFDTHISLEVLEHLPDPYKYFEEARRILKPGGIMIFSVPFLYREHGSPEYHDDYLRFTKNSFRLLANKFGFKCNLLLSNTGVGTTVCILINTYLIRKVLEGKLLTKIIFFSFCPIIFLVTNLFGAIFDIVPDERYAIRNFAILERI